MSNLMDKITSKLGGESGNKHDGPSSNTRSNQRGMGQSDDTYSTEYDDSQGYQQRQQGIDRSVQDRGQGSLNQSGTQDQSYGMYDQENPDKSSGMKQTGRQQGFGTTSDDRWEDRGSNEMEDMDEPFQGKQQQYQRQF